MMMGREKEVFGESFMLYSVWAMVRGGIAPAGGLFCRSIRPCARQQRRLVPGTTPVNFDEPATRRHVKIERALGRLLTRGRCFSAP